MSTPPSHVTGPGEDATAATTTTTTVDSVAPGTLTNLSGDSAGQVSVSFMKLFCPRRMKTVIVCDNILKLR